jgi:hypothetical protein
MKALRRLGVSVFSSEHLGPVAACASTLTRLVLDVRGRVALAPLLSSKELDLAVARAHTT